MRKSFLSLLLLSVTLTGIISCKKANNGQNNSTTGNLLSEFILLDTTLPEPYDTIEVYKYTYDNQQRLSTALETEYFNGHPDTTGTEEFYNKTITLYYNGTDVLAFKNTSIENGRTLDPYAESDTSYFLYDASGRLTKDSTVVSNASTSSMYFQNITYNYNYTATGVIELENEYAPVASVYSDTVIQNASAGNIISQINHGSDGANFGTGGTTYTSFNANYILDTHPNPLYGNGFALQPIPGSVISDLFTDGIKSGVQKNNYIQIDETDNYTPSGGNDTHVRYQYIYNINGYPSSFTRFDISNGGNTFDTKGVYIYK